MVMNYMLIFLLVLLFSTVKGANEKKDIQIVNQSYGKDDKDVFNARGVRGTPIKKGEVKFYKRSTGDRNYLSMVSSAKKGGKADTPQETLYSTPRGNSYNTQRQNSYITTRGDSYNTQRNNSYKGLRLTSSFAQTGFNKQEHNKYLYSALQIMIDQFCHPGIGRCLNDLKNCACYSKLKLVRSSKFYSCLENCGKVTSCPWHSSYRVIKLVPHEYILNKMISTCVVSSLQRKLDKSCGENKLYRLKGPKHYCIPYDIIDINKSGSYCLNNDKKEIFCYGYFSYNIAINFEEYETTFDEHMNAITNNNCNETVEENSGLYYEGCQNISISGKKCLPWDDLNIVKLLGITFNHNFCRNPEQHSQIYCFVQASGFIYREFCEKKKKNYPNNITYSGEITYSFDITMKNVSDFDIGLSYNDCSTLYVPLNNPNLKIIKNVLNYKYHDIDGEIALTISFNNFAHKNFISDTLSICACFFYYYSEKILVCSDNSYKTKVGTFHNVKPFSSKKSNVFYLDKNNNFSIDINTEQMKKEIFIFSGNYSYECNTLNVLYSSYEIIYEVLLNEHFNELIQQINPPLDPSKKYSHIYAYSDNVFDLQSFIRRNDAYINGIKLETGNSRSRNSGNRGDTFFQKLNNLKQGSNIICMRHATANGNIFSYVGRIIYNEKSSSKTKYILRKRNSIYENLMYLNEISNFDSDHFFSFSPDNCENSDILHVTEKKMDIMKEDNVNRYRNYYHIYSYNYYKTYYGTYSGGFYTDDHIQDSFENKNSLYYFSVKEISNVKNTVNYLCERNSKNEKFNPLSLVNFSDFLFVQFDEFAHHFGIYDLPSSVYNYKLTNELCNFMQRHFYFKGISFLNTETKILSVWTHEKENFISLWLVTSKSPTPFFLIKYDIHAPRFAFIEFNRIKNPTYSPNARMGNLARLKSSLRSSRLTSSLEPAAYSSSSSITTITSADIYIFSMKKFLIKKYRTNDFYKFHTVKRMYYLKLVQVVHVHKFTYNKNIFFFLLFKKNFISILNSDLEEVTIINDNLNVYINATPIKIQCLGHNKVTCFVLYEMHKILWFDILFDANSIVEILMNMQTGKGNGVSGVSGVSGVNGVNTVNTVNTVNVVNKGNVNDQSRSTYGGSSAQGKPTLQRAINSYGLEKSRNFLMGYEGSSSVVGAKHVYSYEEKDVDILLGVSTDMLVISKLEEYVIYISSKKTNRLHIYATDSSEKTIAYYKYVTNEHVPNYEINSLFGYIFGNINFINSFITKEGNIENVIYSFVHENLSVTMIIYRHKTLYTYTDNITLVPIIIGDKRQIKYFTLHYKNKKLKDQNLSINKKTGVINIKFSKVFINFVQLDIVMHGLFHIYTARVSFHVTCEDGHYFKDKTCYPCEKGYYNNIKEIKKNLTYNTKCLPCGENKTTLVEKETNPKNCLCDLGYEYIKNPNNTHKFICSPCSYGEYKNIISNGLCRGDKCKENSTSTILGAKNELESTCFCNPGFFQHYNTSGVEECNPCPNDYFCPGKLEKKKKCPPYNKTQRTNRNNFSTIDSCFCEEGYEPINITKIKKKKSRDKHYYNIFFAKYSYPLVNIDPRHICKECNVGYYKDTISSDQCIKCPNKSTTKKFGSTSIHSCNLCYPGYYKNLYKVCSECLPDHFCVGTSTQKDLLQYTGDAVVCPNNSVTHKPYKINTSFKNCLCIKGYVKNLQESYNINQHCKVVPLNSYKDTVSNHLGTPCPSNSGTLKVGAISANECICNKGYFYDNSVHACVECPTGYYCPEKNMKTKFMKPIKCPNNSSNTNRGSYELSNCRCNFGYTVNAKVQNLNAKQVLLQRVASLLPSGAALLGAAPLEASPNQRWLKHKIEKTLSDPVNAYPLLMCVKCPISTYKSNIANEACQECPKNSKTLKNFNSSDVFFCLCDKGYYLEEQTCKACSFGKMYCEGESIFKITPEIYNRIINDVMKYIHLFSDSHKKQFINSVINHYSSYTSNLQLSGSGNMGKQRGGHEILEKGIEEYNPFEEYPVKIYSRMSKIVPGEQKLSLPKWKRKTSKPNTTIMFGVEREHMPNGASVGELEITFLKNYFYKNHRNVIYAKHRKFVPCQKNTVIPLGVDSSQTYDDCKCAKGYYLESRDDSKSVKLCKPCEEGTFKNFVGDEKFCVSCPPKSTSLKGSIYPSHCFCKEGFFYSKEKCLECLEGATCKGGLYENTMKKIKLGIENIQITPDDHTKPESKRGYYLDESITKLVDVSEWKFIKCPISGACLEKNICHYTYLNISSGFYRRSIHSIVIKIAVNYISSMLVIRVLEDNNLLWPKYMLRFYNKMNKLVTIGGDRKIVSIDCLLRHFFDISYADSFFYTSLVFFLIPIMLMITLTVMLFIILNVYTFVKKKVIANKLDLLRIAKKEKIFFLANSLEKSYSKERFIMILRYIKLEKYTLIDRLFIFFEDMIPVYVTFLFIMHAKTALAMFQLFDCSYIKYTKHFGKYILSRASSIQCNFKKDYFRFFVLGIVGTIVWSLGIPLLSFFVLYINRHNLFLENIRIKYGFLHNGYLPNRWYWEVFVFSRKLCVLFITTVILFPSDEAARDTSRLLLVTFVAIFSLCIHFIFQPFDKRNFFTLNKLENFSLYIWVSTIIVISVLLSMNLSELLTFLLAEIVERKMKQEPLIYYDKNARCISIVLPELVTKRKKKWGKLSYMLRNVFKGLSTFGGKKNGYTQLEKEKKTERRVLNGYGVKAEVGSNSTYDEEILQKSMKNSLQSVDHTGGNNILPDVQHGRGKYSLQTELIKNQRMKFCFFLKSTNVSINGNISKEHRMFAIEIYKELFDIFLKNVTLTYISDNFFEFIFKTSINIGKLIDNLDQKEKIFESLDKEQNFKNIIQWSLERKEKYNETKKLEESKLLAMKYCKSDYNITGQHMDTLNISSSFCDNDMESSYGTNKTKEGTTRQRIYAATPFSHVFHAVSTEERKKLFSFFSDDLLDRKIPLSEFYFILLELKLKYFRNLTSYFHMFKLYKMLEKNRKGEQIKRLNRKLQKCQRLNGSSRKKSNEENNQMKEIKGIHEKIPVLYKECRNLSKVIEQLKGEYVNLSKNDMETHSLKECANENFDDDISLSSQGSTGEDFVYKQLG
ncbi:cysteine repeat modular protein 1, putative [Plasmodium ovale wallikeri]|uniref:Cysteine repeat modular protein 1, putative n=1 Tax=Plasmodium ovale wallikeri TaxID=864142 RepID=A0A1A8YPA6_PLAOA|nr:cysteine repeat modular protein 1, putative [Plasmodium ovale wallikeri]SBT33764.1 cysteine repeat modular protein 1, putative [Plasmodium ovale wallikeri]